ncbi:MAG: hypothetical protein C0461_02150 [Brevundimonas sp.]|nr:hypothetical protein [Brevundimonas sp.]
MRVRLTGGDRGSINRAPLADGRVMILNDDLVPGFMLRVSKRQSTYYVVTRVKGCPGQIRRSLGTTRNTELGIAREAARRIIENAQKGIPPEGETVDSSGSADTFRSVVETYFQDTLRTGGAKLRTKDAMQAMINRDLTEWLDRPIDSITAREVSDLVYRKAQTAPMSANRLTSLIKKIMRWAKRRHIITFNPAADVEKPSEEQSRDRYLTDEEIQLIWDAADRVGDPYGRLVQMALVTGQRRGEVAGMRRSELGLLEQRDGRTGETRTIEAWLLPAERTKRQVAHAVPLSPLAKRLIYGAPKLVEDDKPFDYIFASGLAGDQPPSGWSKYARRLDKEIGEAIARAMHEPYDKKKHVMPGWHLHDLRRTMATHMEMLGVDRRVISRLLNHSEGDKSVTAIYARYRFDAEAAEAMDLWCAKIERLTGANIVAIRPAGAA